MDCSIFQSVTKFFRSRWRKAGQGVSLVLLSAIATGGVLTATCAAQEKPRGEPISDRPSLDRPSLDRPTLERLANDRALGPILHEVRKQVFSSRLDFMALLSHCDVRAAVGMSEEEFVAFSESNRVLFDEIRLHFQDRRGQQVRDQGEVEKLDQDPSKQNTSERAAFERQQLVARIVDVVKQSDQKFVDELRESVDYDRFLQILIQARGNRSVVHEDVATRIGLSMDKLDEIRTVSHRVWREQWESMGDRMRELMRREENQRPLAQGKKMEARQLIERAERMVDEAIAQRLSSQQREALVQHRGEPFALPDDLFELRFPGPPGRRGLKGEHREERSSGSHY